MAMPTWLQRTIGAIGFTVIAGGTVSIAENLHDGQVDAKAADAEMAQHRQDLKESDEKGNQESDQFFAEQDAKDAGWRAAAAEADALAASHIHHHAHHAPQKSPDGGNRGR